MAALAGKANALSSTGAVLEPLNKSLYVSNVRVTFPFPVNGSPGTEPPGGGVGVGPCGVLVGVAYLLEPHLPYL